MGNTTKIKPTLQEFRFSHSEFVLSRYLASHFGQNGFVFD